MEFHLQSGVDGFYISGTTGQGILQSVAERTEVMRAVIERVQARAKVIVHVAAPTTKDAAALAGEAGSLGADAVSSVPPLFFRVPFDGVLDYYGTVAEAAGLPLLVYYIPGLSAAFSLD